MMASGGEVNPDYVLSLNRPCQGFLCPFEANQYGIDFIAFNIRDAETEKVVFEVSKDPNAPMPELPPNFDYDRLRYIAYRFPAEFLSYRTVATTLTFKVGPQEVHNFRMIERHYFRDRLIRSYDFTFHFCIPNSTNTWEAIYEVPELDPAEIEDMINNPHAVQSDSFYFVQDKLIMHNKASYEYVQ
eukprot:TRINITY_DN13312_c0_g2_i1.p1 TRINITY_DN13312_c0_g2~~TRINITY_DN13312_c0_g2_i1.p1  ORF type:complete len:186 (-),score=37.91 TRINITY_DN13312_c0_g2_i1:310-867(-)